ncbi:MAG: NAD-dependent epimerase/dehydratase family protein, partial [Aristaeellaceae bacterium]
LQTENIRCAVEAVDAAAQMGCHVFVGSGSQAECGRVDGLIRPDTPCFPETGYGIAKLCAGQMTRVACRQRGIRHVWGRILSAYGPNDGPLSLFPTMMGKLLRGEKPALTAGEQLWDFLYADDVAQALYCMAVSGRDGAVYPIGSGQARPLKDYFRILRDAIDPALPLGIGELPYAPHQVMHLQADISALQRDTGFAPAVPFEEGIRETLRQYKEKLERKAP